MKILGIVGILDLPGSEKRLWRHMRQAFLQEFPDATFDVAHELYFPWQKEKMQRFADRIVAAHDTDEDLLLVGYSLGGVIACAIAPRFKRSRLRAVATIGAPHSLIFFYRMLGAERKPLSAPLITFGALFDLLVPFFLSKHPYATEHRQLFADHLFTFLISPGPARTIAKVLRSIAGLS